MPTGFFYTQTAIGNREDLTDVLTNISPLETPFISSIGRTTATNTLHEWQTDTLAAAAANAAVEGASGAAASGAVSTRLTNRTQIFTKIASITGTERAMNPAGRADEWSYQLEKRTKELARDIELQCVVSTAVAAGDVTGDTGRQLEGLGLGGSGATVGVASAGFAGWLTSNLSNQLTTASDAATVRKNLTETIFNDLLATIWTTGGRPDAIHVGGYNKRVISSFTSNNTRFLSIAPDGGIALNTDVEYYRSDFGRVRIILNRYVPGTFAAAIETQYFKLAVLRPLFRKELGTTGDRDSIELVTELTVAAYAPTSSGMWMAIASAAGATS